MAHKRKAEHKDSAMCLSACVCVFEKGLPISIKHIVLIKPERIAVIQLVQAGEWCVCADIQEAALQGLACLLLLLATDLHGEQQQHCIQL